MIKESDTNKVYISMNKFFLLIFLLQVAYILIDPNKAQLWRVGGLAGLVGTTLIVGTNKATLRSPDFTLSNQRILIMHKTASLLILAITLLIMKPDFSDMSPIVILFVQISLLGLWLSSFTYFVTCNIKKGKTWYGGTKWTP